MTGYTQFWDCRICDKRQETDGYPRVFVCEDCLRPLAKRLCREKLSCEMNSPGVDQRYFIQLAYDYALTLLGKGQGPTRGKQPSPMVGTLNSGV